MQSPAKISGSYKIIDVSTAKILKTSAYTEKAMAKCSWGSFGGDKRALSTTSKRLCNKQQENIPSIDEMVSTTIEKLAKKLSKDIDQYLN